MMNADEQLQDSIERGGSPDSDDAKAYGVVFKALKTSPYELPAHFADSVVSRMESSSRDILWLATGLAVLICGAGASFYFSGAEGLWSINLVGVFSGYSGVIFFGIVFAVIINWIDRRYIRAHLRGSD